MTKDGEPAKLLDLEGIALASDGGFWLASEGNPEREKNKTQSTLVKVDASGAIVEEIALPGDARRKAHALRLRGRDGDRLRRRRDGLARRAARVEGRSQGHDQAPGLQARRQELGRRPLSARQGRTRAGSASPRSPRSATASSSIERDNQVGRDAKVKKLTYRLAQGRHARRRSAAEIPVRDQDRRSATSCPISPRPAASSSTRSRASPSTRTAMPSSSPTMTASTITPARRSSCRLGKLDMPM